MKQVILSRKEQCPRCRHKGITFSSAFDGRPRMTCDRCGDSWTNGRQGAKTPKRKKERLPPGLSYEDARIYKGA